MVIVAFFALTVSVAFSPFVATMLPVPVSADIVNVKSLYLSEFLRSVTNCSNELDFAVVITVVSPSDNVDERLVSLFVRC